MQALEKLHEMKAFSEAVTTRGLSDDEIESFLKSDAKLDHLVDGAYKLHVNLRSEFKDLLSEPESVQIEQLQSRFVNFYSPDAVNPYIALAASGPWIVTSCGAVIHDSGGYGMLGFGHAPLDVLDAIRGEQVMANIMTASFAQHRFIEKLKAELGYSRTGSYKNPYDRFMCLNSGSESVTMAARISDLNAKRLTQKSARHEGKSIKILGLRGSFHGRTDRPAQFSDSCLPAYKKFLASFENRDNYETVEVNDVGALNACFEKANRQGVFFEAMFIEPVMGEGNPGMAILPEFYAKARELCSKNGTLLAVDSIQAGLRAHGCLSIVDYPGFQELDGPDMETFSKALNAGQYPLSVLALKKEAADLYQTGIYGNTMTSNPRALDVATVVLSNVTSKLRHHICQSGKEFLDELKNLKKEFPELVGKVQGTGLLLAIEIDPEKAKVVGKNGLEQKMRRLGIGVIHGGSNALRFTPHFLISSKEIKLIIGKMRSVFASVTQKDIDQDGETLHSA